ncbi:MAG: hypothetical protein O7G88_10905, partial [bacterium]|nr:hypothetical protein [bacterium]
TSRFTSSSHERFLALIDAAQHVGHSRLVAFRSVLEFINPWNAYRALRELCKTLVTGPESSKARRQCYEAGGRIEAASRNNLEALVGLAIQRVASKASGWPKAPQWVARIDTRRDELFRLIDRLNALAPDLSEELWLRYIEVFAEQSEEAAIRFVTKDTERRK